MKKAGFWRRFTALSIDTLIVILTVGKGLADIHKDFKQGIPSRGKKLMRMTFSDPTRQKKLLIFRFVVAFMYILILPAIYDIVLVSFKKGPLDENWSKNFLVVTPSKYAKQAVEGKSAEKAVETKSAEKAAETKTAEKAANNAAGKAVTTEKAVENQPEKKTNIFTKLFSKKK